LTKILAIENTKSIVLVRELGVNSLAFRTTRNNFKSAAFYWSIEIGKSSYIPWNIRSM